MTKLNHEQRPYQADKYNIIISVELALNSNEYALGFFIDKFGVDKDNATNSNYRRTGLKIKNIHNFKAYLHLT